MYTSMKNLVSYGQDRNQKATFGSYANVRTDYTRSKEFLEQLRNYQLVT